MIEEKWIRKFYANNPFLTDRMKKLEEQKRVESNIINDLGYIVAYQQNFVDAISVDLVYMRDFLSKSQANNINNDTKPKNICLFKQFPKKQQLAITENTMRLIELTKQLRKTLFQWINPDNDFVQIHNLFDDLICYRNKKYTKYKNTFTPLPLFAISQESQNSNLSKKCQGFSKLLSRSSPYIGFSYLPTKSSISQIQKYVENDNLYLSLKKLSDDLKVTMKELLILKSEYQTSNLLIQDFIQFPPFDIIRESPVFNELNSSISYSIDYVRSEIPNLQKTLSDMISEIIPRFESLVDYVSLLPQFNVELNFKERANFYKEKHKLLLFQFIFEKEKMIFLKSVPEYEAFIFIRFDHENFSKLSELKEKEPDQLSSHLESVFDKYSPDTIKEELKKESENLKSKNAEIENRIAKWKAKKLPSLPDKIEKRKTELIEITQQLRDKIYNDQVETSKLINDTISSFKDKIKALKISKPLIPLNFEDVLNYAYQEEPMLKWVNQKLNFHKKENQRKKETIKNMKLNNENLKDEIEEKKRILSLVKSKNEKSENHQTSHKQGKCPKYLCPICKSRQRDTYISSCGHTFCGKCLLVLIRKGSQCCPNCDKAFLENNMIPIMW